MQKCTLDARVSEWTFVTCTTGMAARYSVIGVGTAVQQYYRCVHVIPAACGACCYTARKFGSKSANRSRYLVSYFILLRYRNGKMHRDRSTKTRTRSTPKPIIVPLFKQSEACNFADRLQGNCAIYQQASDSVTADDI